MAQEHNDTMNPDAGIENKNPTEDIKTLGVLFVHGIGSQKRGDTLAQCGSAIHSWLHNWITQPSIEEGSILVDLLDTSLTQPMSDEPAHSRLIIHKKESVAEKSLLLTESCWAEAFHPPRYLEFIQWALKVLPITVFLHLIRSFRRNLRIMNSTSMALKEKSISPETENYTQLQMELGPRYGALPTEWSSTLSNILFEELARTHTWLFFSPFRLVALLVVAFLVQIILLAVMVIGLLPIGFLRTLANRIQKTLAGVLGDSYLFVTSPISASSAVTQVKKDFEWLANRCDGVVILAHSQGAAVAYRAIEEWSWENKISKKLKLFITYGEGLQKLFDLKELSKDRTADERSGIRMAAVLASIGSLAIMASGLWLFDIIPFLLSALSLTIGYILLMLALTLLSKLIQEDPEFQVGVHWKDFFASKDPVPNGPITCSVSKLDESNKVFSSLGKTIVNFFHLGSRHEVVNLQSSLADHNSYWSAKDDFVSRVIMQLFDIWKVPSPATPDNEWLDVSRQRRRWRVGLRSRCRSVAILAAFSIVCWPRNVIEALGDSVARQFCLLWERLPKQYIPDWIQSGAIMEWQYGLGVGALLVSIIGMFAIAATGYRIWERLEYAHFFRREPYRLTWIGLVIFALGWIGLLGVIPATIALIFGAQALWPTAWTSALLLAISSWWLMRAGKGPGRATSWISTLLERGEFFLEKETGDRSENLMQARGFFVWANKWINYETDSMELVRGLQGAAQVLEHNLESSKKDLELAKSLYETALTSLECMGKDTDTVRKRLDALSKRLKIHSDKVESSVNTKEAGESPR